VDKDHWGDPENFRPERHIDESGKFIKDPFLMVFGHGLIFFKHRYFYNLAYSYLGPRLCVGEPLARDTLFIFITSVLNKFKFSLPPNEPAPSLEAKLGLVLSPLPHKLMITELN
jgi:methyl farnesoate epoxidase / farnesoate epoxidase